MSTPSDNSPAWIMDRPISWAAKAHYLSVMACFERHLYFREFGENAQADAELGRIPEPNAPGVMPLIKELEAVGAVQVEQEDGETVYRFVMLADLEAAAQD